MGVVVKKKTLLLSPNTIVVLNTSNYNSSHWTWPCDSQNHQTTTYVKYNRWLRHTRSKISTISGANFFITVRVAYDHRCSKSFALVKKVTHWMNIPGIGDESSAVEKFPSHSPLPVYSSHTPMCIITKMLRLKSYLIWY